MKNSHLLLGILLILIGGISLSSIFWEDKIPQKTKLVENKKEIEDPQLDSSVNNQIQTSLSHLPIKTKKENISSSDTTNDIAESLATQVIQDRESKRMDAIERRKNKMAERKRYKTARVEWRKALNEARKEAKLSGHYSKFEAIKKHEPGKE